MEYNTILYSMQVCTSETMYRSGEGYRRHYGGCAGVTGQGQRIYHERNTVSPAIR